MTKHMGDRVRERRDELGMTQAALAKLIGCSQPMIKKIEAGSKTSLGRKLAEALQVSLTFLETGEEETGGGRKSSVPTGIPSSAEDRSGITIRKNETLPGPIIGEKLPLLTWDLARRTWDRSMELLAGKDVRDWLYCPAPHSAEAFCLENNTDAMDDGTVGGYREGEILFVDPAVPVTPEKDIIVIFPDGRMTIRRLKEDGEGRYLLSLNGKRIERWQPGTIVRGVVIFSGKFR